MTTRYERGRDSEYRAQRELESLGFQTLRSSGSHGAADVIAWSPEQIRFIQCKTWIKSPSGYSADIEKLNNLTLPPESSAELWGRKIGQKGWAFQTVIKTRIEQ